jgi:hypothetical protein
MNHREQRAYTNIHAFSDRLEFIWRRQHKRWSRTCYSYTARYHFDHRDKTERLVHCREKWLQETGMLCFLVENLPDTNTRTLNASQTLSLAVPNPKFSLVLPFRIDRGGPICLGIEPIKRSIHRWSPNQSLRTAVVGFPFSQCPRVDQCVFHQAFAAMTI